MDLDSLWMVHWEDRRTVETRSHAGVSVWRIVLCGIARLSCLPEFPVTNDLKCLNDLGRNCIMDLSDCGMLSPSDSVAAGPGGTDGPLSSSDWAGVLVPAVPAGIPFPVGPAGPVGLEGTLSASDYVSGVLVDPGGTLPSSDLLTDAASGCADWDTVPSGPCWPC